MNLAHTYTIHPYTQVHLSLSLEGKISPLQNVPLDILPYSTMFPGRSAIVQTVPLSAKYPPMLIVLGRVYREQWKEQVSLKYQA